MKKDFVIFYFCLLSLLFNPINSIAENFIVPFQNIPLPMGATIVSDYSFGPHAMIFCFNITLNTGGIITWPYNGQTQVGNLPIFLKTSPNFEGEFADSDGIIQITNNLSQDTTVSCLFGF